ncbi:MAG: hypothetical protein HN742_18720 [Lentisphaerae bacterium]|jgi:hypothetical protein|nr:hypothetical protein [Lentisphaerota bacterium]MBT4820098.1 hypothetical protein [Lentisphaerota bacterium]MBT5605738.1 hypothetical protein [Lentisphaerota bacterium]MBT7053939.1 hypothetical protein [Lentisphaerota bacterium]MBT7843919.1 hypothetical protein [Lentisphaerota bacterium]
MTVSSCSRLEALLASFPGGRAFLSPILATALASTVYAAPNPGQAMHDPDHALVFQVGDLKVTIGDHYAHGGSDRPSYTGIHHLSHRLRESNVFCPLYAGMIGIRKECTIRPVGKNGAVLTVGTGKSEVSETYTVKAPHYVDHAARFTAGRTTGSWNSTSYMNGPADPAIYIIQTNGEWARHYSETHGDRASIAPKGMDPLPKGNVVENAKYAHGTNGFWDGFSDLRFDPDFPLFYGRFDDMVLIFMVERKWGSDLIPYMSPSGGGYSKEWERTNPAWDYRYRLRNLTPGAEVVIRSRVCYKRFVSDEDILAEYEAWQKQLETGSR